MGGWYMRIGFKHIMVLPFDRECVIAAWNQWNVVCMHCLWYGGSGVRACVHRWCKLRITGKRLALGPVCISKQGLLRLSGALAEALALCVLGKEDRDECQRPGEFGVMASGECKCERRTKVCTNFVNKTLEKIYNKGCA